MSLLKAAPWLPVIILTGVDDDRVALDTARASAQDYLNKRDSGGTRLTNAIRLAIERKRHELLLTSHALEQAHTDDLTGLTTRGLLEESWPQIISLYHRADWGRALIVADLDGFKAVNDTFGRQT